MAIRFFACVMTCAWLAHASALLAHGTETHERNDVVPATDVAPVMAPGEQAPQVALALASNADGVLEARVDVTDFRFTDGPGGAGDGHARLSIDGETVAAVRSAIHRLPRLQRGTHVIEVALVTDDGAPYVVDGRPAAAQVVYRVGRAAGDGLRGAPRRFALDIENGQVATRTLRVTQGDVVQLVWRSDAVAILHLHGYDIEARVTPDAPLTMQFEADIGGRFPVALHGAQDSEAGGHGHRSLLHLEVHPE